MRWIAHHQDRTQTPTGITSAKPIAATGWAASISTTRRSSPGPEDHSKRTPPGASRSSSRSPNAPAHSAFHSSKPAPKATSHGSAPTRKTNTPRQASSSPENKAETRPTLTGAEKNSSNNFSRSPVVTGPSRPLPEPARPRTCSRPSESGADTSLQFLDLDGFKNVNDSFGHDAGDAVLGYLARLLQEAVRPGDTPARLGGDEFAILLEATSHSCAREFAELVLTKAQSRCTYGFGDGHEAVDRSKTRRSDPGGASVGLLGWNSCPSKLLLAGASAAPTVLPAGPNIPDSAFRNSLRTSMNFETDPEVRCAFAQ